jgi:hypothetical protein
MPQYLSRAIWSPHDQAHTGMACGTSSIRFLPLQTEHFRANQGDETSLEEAACNHDPEQNW